MLGDGRRLVTSPSRFVTGHCRAKEREAIVRDLATLVMQMRSLAVAPRRTVRGAALMMLPAFVALPYASGRSLVADARPIPTRSSGVSSVGTTGTFVALSVPDLEASAGWYERSFALKRVMTVPRIGAIAGVVALEGPGLLVELIQHDSARVDTERPELTHGIAKAGFMVDDFDAAVATLRARGVAFIAGPYPARPGRRANVIFRDNAGNVWQLFGKEG
jgi:catechol 2,3-dioxygenase-like lactoylglutathione lyase family enzyme